MTISIFTDHLPTPFKRLHFTICIVFITTLLSTPTYADSLNVSATVPAALPTSPAIITSVIDQEHVTTTPLEISGTCGDGAYVTIDVNGTLAGIGNCTSGSFDISVALETGENQLQTHVYNVTDGEGPRSPLLTIFLDSPRQATSSVASLPFIPLTSLVPIESPHPPSTSPLKLHYDYHYKIYRTHEQWQGTFTVEGGQQPYKLNVDWNDNSTTTDTIDSNSTFTLDHTFLRPDVFQPIIRITDQSGATVYLQLLVVVQDPTTTTADSATTPPETVPTLITVGIVAIIATTAEIFGATQFLRVWKKK